MIGSSDVRDVLAVGDLEVEGRLSGASNATLRAVASLDGVDVVCVYKPRRGERPLWDFPSGSLGEREVATYLVSRASGWDLVPLTVWREDGPYGPGMCQLWIDADAEAGPVRVLDAVPRGAWLTVAEGEGYDGGLVRLLHEDSADLRRLSLLDVIVNNADRKGGHALRDESGRLFAIDHGLTFHDDDKLRTVLWGWAGAPIDPADLADLERLAGRWSDVADELVPWLTTREVRSAGARLHALLAARVHPEPEGAWPALPWPAM